MTHTPPSCVQPCSVRGACSPIATSTRRSDHNSSVVSDFAYSHDSAWQRYTRYRATETVGLMVLPHARPELLLLCHGARPHARYRPPEEMLPWLLGLVRVAEAISFPLTLSDVTLAGSSLPTAKSIHYCFPIPQ